MATKAQKIRVGAFVVASVTLLAVVLIVFGGMRFWEKDHHYHIVFSGSVMGLETGAFVYLNGMRVGRVDKIGVDPDDLRRVRVRIALKENTPIHADTKAMLQFAGITGLKIIDLRDGTHGSPELPPGSTIAEGEGVLDKLEKEAKTIADQSRQLMDKANRIVENLVVLTDPKKFEGVETILAHSAAAAQNLEKTSASLDAMVAENRVALKSTLASVENVATSASTMIDTQVTGLLGKAGEFVTGLDNIVRVNEGQLRSAMFDLRQASRNLKEMSREVRQRPSRLLFSSPPTERKLP